MAEKPRKTTQNEQANQDQRPVSDATTQARQEEQERVRDAIKSTDMEQVKQAAQATPEERNAAIAQAQVEAAQQRLEQEQGKPPVYKLNDGRVVDANGNEVKQQQKKAAE